MPKQKEQSGAVSFAEFVAAEGAKVRREPSVIDQFGAEVLAAEAAGATYALMLAWLAANGVTVTRQTLAAWIRSRKARLARQAALLAVPAASPVQPLSAQSVRQSDRPAISKPAGKPSEAVRSTIPQTVAGDLINDRIRTAEENRQRVLRQIEERKSKEKEKKDAEEKLMNQILKKNSEISE